MSIYNLAAQTPQVAACGQQATGSPDILGPGHIVWPCTLPCLVPACSDGILSEL